MTDEKWQDLVYMVEEKFGIKERTSEEDILQDDLGNIVKGEREIIIFENEMGEIKLERTKRPLITDKKMHYHKGAGGVASVEFVTSKDEYTRNLKAFVFNSDKDEWEELKLQGGTIIF